MSALPQETNWQPVPRIGRAKLSVVLRETPIQPSILSGLIIARGRLEIPGIRTLEQDFRVLSAGKRIVIENEPENSWPKFVIEFDVDSVTQRAHPASFLMWSSNNSVDGDILYTRSLIAINRDGQCSLNLNENRFDIIISPLSAQEKEALLERAKLCRKLKFIEETFNHKFSLPPGDISATEIRIIDIIFQAITQGEFSTRARDLLLLQVPPGEVDLNKPPFSSPGSYSYQIKDEDGKIILFGRVLDLGAWSFWVKNAITADPEFIERLRKEWRQPVDIKLLLLDHQIHHRFETYAPKTAKEQRERKRNLENFIAKLSQHEPDELAKLVMQPLMKDVSPNEAAEIIMDWLIYQELPNYLFPKPLSTSEKADRLEVEIWLSDFEKKKGIELAGKAIVDKKTGEIISHTSIDELREKALALINSYEKKETERSHEIAKWIEEQRWLKDHRKEYGGRWVALNGYSLISSSSNPREVFEEARKSGIKLPLIVRVEPLDELPFAGW